MPLKLNVGVSRKIGLPEYSSVGASCQVEVELDSALLEHDLDGFHAHVRGVFIAARQAVNDELARIRAQTHVAPAPQAPTVQDPVPRHAPEDPANGAAAPAAVTPGRPVEAVHRPAKRATPSQVKAIHALARVKRTHLERLLRDEYGVDRPEDLSLFDASLVIEHLRRLREE